MLTFRRSFTVSNVIRAKPEPCASQRIDVTLDNQYEKLADVVTPLWRHDYSEQLFIKKNSSREFISRLKDKLPKSLTTLRRVVPSPSTSAYRNKDEFSIRKGVDGNPKTVGFFIGSPAKGEVICVPGTKLINLKQIHIDIAEAFQNLIRDSPLRACHDLHDGGFWRSVLVRSNSKDETMVAVACHSAGATEEQVNRVKRDVVDLFSSLNVNSVYFQSSPHVRSTIFEHLHGQTHLIETIGNFTFRISPGSFFQINTDAAARMYEVVLDLCQLTERSTLLDLCCGIGSLSIVASERVRGCVGVECIEESVIDANHNAKLNNVVNCHFVTGRLEKHLSKILSELDLSTELCAVLNPGRAGVVTPVLKQLRCCRFLKRLVYIACKADSPNTFKNFVYLCDPHSKSGTPFRLREVVPVDMFPHTNHIEMILLFERD